MTRFLTASSQAALVLGVAWVLVGCQPAPQNDELNAKVAALETSLSEVVTNMAADQKALLREFQKVKATQMTMIRRGALIAPELMEKQVNIGEQTDVSVAGAPVLGDLLSPVEVVEFGEFQCPYCMKHSDFLATIVEQHPGRVRAAFRHFPIGRHKMAVPAARAAWAAQQQGKFWEMHDALFAARGKFTPESIREIAEGLGLDMELYDLHVASYASERAVYADRKDGKRLGVKGTPAYYVNGKYFGGEPEAVIRAIDNALLRAEAREKKAKSEG